MLWLPLFMVAVLHLHPLVRVPLARGAIFPHPKVTTLGRVALGYVPNEVLGWGSCNMGFAIGALAWSSLSFSSSSSLLQSEGIGFHVGGLTWVSITMFIFLYFASIITSLSNILATLGHLQGVFGLKVLSKFLSTSLSRNSLEGVPWVSLSLFKKDDGGLLCSLQGMNVFSLECLSCQNMWIPFSVITSTSIVTVSSGITNFRNPSH